MKGQAMRKPPEVVQFRWLWNLHIFAQDVMYLAAKSGSHVFLCHSRLTPCLPQSLSRKLLQKMEPMQDCMVYKCC